MKWVRGVFREWEEHRDHQGTQGHWGSQALMVLLVKMEWQACQGTAARQVKKVSQGLQVRGVLQGREVDLGSLVVEVTTPKMHSPLLAQLDREGRGEAQAPRAPRGCLDLQGHQEMMLWSIMMKSRTSFASRSSRSLMREWPTTCLAFRCQ